MKILFAKKDAAIAILSALIVALVNWIVMRPEASAMRAWTKATESPSAEASAEPTVTLASQLSPNGKSLIESYGRITNVKAGGMYSAEGIRLLDVDTGQSIWTMEPGYYQQHFEWSPDSRYVSVYYEAHYYGETVIVDAQEKKEIALP